MYCLLNHGKVHTERATQAGTLPLRQASSGHNRNIKPGKIPSYPSPSTYSNFQQTPVWEFPLLLCASEHQGVPSVIPEDIFTQIPITSSSFYAIYIFMYLH